MGSLSNLYISQSYQSLIHLGTNNTASANLIELQDGLGNSIGVAVNTNGDLFLSGSLTASLQQGYLYVGGANGKTTAFATSSLVTNINTGSLVTTSSFNSYTQSTNIRLDNLETTSASVNVSISNLNSTTASQGVSITNLNASSASQQVSINALNVFTASQSTASIVTSINELNTFSASAKISISALNTNSASVNTSVTNINTFTQSAQISINAINAASSSWITESETSSFARTNVDNNFTANQTFTNITATSASITYLTTLYETASVIYSSGSNQLGDELTDIQTLSGSVKVQGSLTVNGTPVLTSSVDISGLVTTASFNAYTQSNDQKVNSLIAATGSYATTGSNTFTGDQTLIDNAGNFFTISDASGSMMLVGKSYTSASAHISASSAGIGNFIFKNNNNTADTIISGSNNIFTNPGTPTVGFKRYLSNNNIALAAGFPQISGSMQFSPTVNANMFGINSLIMRGPVSSSAWAISANNLLGAVNIGSSATNNAEKAVAGFTMTGNSVNGTLNFVANRSLHTQTNQITNNIIGGGTTTLTAASSSIIYTNNIGGNISVTNNTSGGLTSNSANAINVTGNLFVGSANTITASGSQDPGDTSGTSYLRHIDQNQIFGVLNGVNLPYAPTGSNSLNATMIAGYGLGVTGSNASGFVSGFEYGGSAFFGRYNAQNGNRAQSAQTVFAIGTGTSTTRKTGFLIDSGSNTFIEGTLNVSGATSLNGTTNITGSLLVNGNIVSAVNTGSFATTGSNSFIGNQTITGSLTVSGSGVQVRLPQFDATQGRIKETLSFTGSRFATGIISTSIEMENLSSYQFGFNQLATGDSLTGTQFILETNKDSGFTELKLNARYTGSNNADIAIRNAAGVRTFTVNADSTTINSSVTINGSLVVNGTTLNPAAYATTGSNSFNGNQTITGSLTISGSIITVDRSGNDGNLYMGLNALGMGSAGSQPLAFGNSVSIAIGQGAMRYASGSQQNVAIGVDALKITSGSNNFALGSYSLESNTTGGENVALGTGALNKNISGQRNVALGGGALFGSTTGDFNIGVGYNTGAALSGSTNVFIGYRSGENFSGSKNVLIGGYRGVGETLNNNIILSDGDGNIKAQYSGSNWNFTNTTISGSLIIQSGSSFFANGNRQFNVGAFSSLVTQSGSAAVSQSMNFEVTDISEGVTIASNSRITLANSGTYNIQFSAQVLADTGADTVWIWLKKNGTNVSSTSTKLVLRNNEAAVAAWNFVVDAVASDYFELAWQGLGGHTKLFAEAAAGNYPAIPSIILTVTQVR